MEPLWIRECVQSFDEVVRHGCDCNRYGDNHADGRKSAHRIRVEHVYAKCGSTARSPSRRFHESLVLWRMVQTRLCTLMAFCRSRAASLKPSCDWTAEKRDAPLRSGSPAGESGRPSRLNAVAREASSAV